MSECGKLCRIWNCRQSWNDYWVCHRFLVEGIACSRTFRCFFNPCLWWLGSNGIFWQNFSIPSYTICNKQYTICNSRAYFPLPRLVFDGWRLLSEALFCNRTTCPLITRLRLSQLFCPLLNNWYTFQIDDQNKDKNRQLTNIGYSWTLPWLKNCSVA